MSLNTCSSQSSPIFSLSMRYSVKSFVADNSDKSLIAVKYEVELKTPIYIFYYIIHEQNPYVLKDLKERVTKEPEAVYAEAQAQKIIKCSGEVIQNIPKENAVKKIDPTKFSIKSLTYPGKKP